MAESSQTNALFGYSVATAGDVNGDGYSDVIVGAHHHGTGDPNEGRAFVYYGDGVAGLCRLPKRSPCPEVRRFCPDEELYSAIDPIPPGHPATEARRCAPPSPSPRPDNRS